METLPDPAVPSEPRRLRRLAPLAVSLAVVLLPAPFLGAFAQEDGEATEEDLRALAEETFVLCDLDGNGWISAREAEATLGLGRSEFRVFDEDRDGRLELEELFARFDDVLERLGMAPEPEVRGVDALRALGIVPERPASAGALDDLLLRYDENEDEALQAGELGILFLDLDIGLEASDVVGQMDADDSDSLDRLELRPLASFVARAAREAETGTVREVSPQAAPLISEEPEEESSEAAGPFERLDVDADDAITIEDLRQLSVGMRLPVRASAVVGAIDANGDGSVDRAEFWASMGHRSRRPAAPGPDAPGSPTSEER